MPVPVTWADLSTTPANNSPKGSEPVGTQMDDYLRSAFAFLKMLPRRRLVQPANQHD